MSFVAAALLIASGALLGGWLAHKTKVPALPPAPDDDDPADDARKLAEPAEAASDPFGAFPCRLGDVILASDGEEAWLESALVLYEEAPVLVVFLAPNAGSDRAILARPDARHDLWWLTAAPPLAWSPHEEPPSSLLHRGDRYERMRRLPLRAVRHGPSAPEVGDTVLLAEYKSLTDRRLVVLLGGTEVLLWEGRVLGAGMYEILPGGA